MSDEYPNGQAFQWVWCRRWHFGFRRFDHSWRLIYRWRLHLGPLEIRRWTPHSEAMRLIEERRAASWGEPVGEE